MDKEEGSSSGLVPKTRHRKRAKTNIFTPSLTAALDRTKLSVRNATYVLAAAAHSLGHNVKVLNINRSVHRERELYREEIGKNLKINLKQHQLHPLLCTGMENSFKTSPESR